MIERRTAVQLQDAIQTIMDKCKIGTIQRITIDEADGRFLAEDIQADHPIPMFDRSMYDGFAVRSSDTDQASKDKPVKLLVTQHIPAGKQADNPIQSGQAMRIMTGAAIPEGADAVVMLEHVREDEQVNATSIYINHHIEAGHSISKRGEDTAQGALLMKKGTRVGAGEKAMLATFGYGQVDVYRQPVVGLFATGSELLAVDEPLQPGKIRNSNSYMLESQVRQLGAVPIHLGILEDEFKSCYRAVNQAMLEVDIVLTTGGASVGDFDFVQAILKEMEADVLFNKTAVRPGSVTTVATKQIDGQQKWIFGLSGNPAACFIGFELFARPVLMTLMGCASVHLPRVQAKVQQDIRPPQDYSKLMRARVAMDGAELHAHLIGLDKSGVVSAFTQANALLVVPAGSDGFRSGQSVDVILLDQATPVFFK